jgi:hypothetical protein
MSVMQLAGKGDFPGALALARRLADESDDPEDRFLFGQMAYLAADFGDAETQLERAYRDFQARGLPRRAAMTATMLGRVHFDLLGRYVPGRMFWLSRKTLSGS